MLQELRLRRQNVVVDVNDSVIVVTVVNFIIIIGSCLVHHHGFRQLCAAPLAHVLNVDEFGKGKRDSLRSDELRHRLIRADLLSWPAR